jgi:toxin ParE1/3/4
VTRHLVLRPEATEEILAATEWYERRGRGLAAEFLRAVDAALASVQRNPLQHPIVHREMRRALLRRFPYAVIYAVSETEIVVLACVHGRQHTRRWQDRR